MKENKLCVSKRVALFSLSIVLLVGVITVAGNYISSQKQSLSSRASAPFAPSLVVLNQLKDLQQQGKIEEAKTLVKEAGLGINCLGKTGQAFWDCVWGVPAASPTSSVTQTNNVNTVAIYWDEQSALINDQLLKTFLSQSGYVDEQHRGYTGMSKEDLTAYYYARNPIQLEEVTGNEYTALIKSMTMVAGGTFGGLKLIGGNPVKLYQLGGLATNILPKLATFVPIALQTSPLVMIAGGSTIAFVYTTTPQYALKMSLVTAPMPSNLKILKPKFTNVDMALIVGSLLTMTSAQTFQQQVDAIIQTGEVKGKTTGTVYNMIKTGTNDVICTMTIFFYLMLPNKDKPTEIKYSYSRDTLGPCGVLDKMKAWSGLYKATLIALPATKVGTEVFNKYVSPVLWEIKGVIDIYTTEVFKALK